MTSQVLLSQANSNMLQIVEEVIWIANVTNLFVRHIYIRNTYCLFRDLYNKVDKVSFKYRTTVGKYNNTVQMQLCFVFLLHDSDRLPSNNLNGFLWRYGDELTISGYKSILSELLPLNDVSNSVRNVFIIVL